MIGLLQRVDELFAGAARQLAHAATETR